MTEKRDHMNPKQSLMSMMLITGFVGGVLWSLIGYLCYYFSFTKIEPNVILEPFTVGTWRESWIGIIISILLYGIISIGTAIVYYLILKKLKTMWIGIGYGIVLFLFVFIILNPIFPGMKPILDLDINTLITSVCIYSLYGVFIGYSISYEYNEILYFKEKDIDQK